MIGNPPYVQLQKMGKDCDDLEKVGYKTFERTGDIYCLFYELGNNILKSNAILTFITSNKWMRAGYGKALRHFFINYTNPLHLIDFAGYQVFETATVDTNILMAQKATYQNNTLTCVIDKKMKSLNNMSDYFRQTAVITKNFSYESSWVVLSSEAATIKSKIEQQGLPLKDWSISIYRGVLTGLNDAFIINSDTKNELIRKSPNSAEIIRPLLRGRDIKSYFPEYSDLWIIFSRRGINIDHYPAIKAHLKKYYEDLKPRNNGESKGRKPGSYEWYEIQDNVAYWKDFENPKIIYPNMTKYLPFVYDKGSYFINDKAFIITGEHLDYLTAFLNSKLFKFCFRDNFPELLGGTRELRKIFFDFIPVKRVDDSTNNLFKKYIDEIFDKKSKGESSKEVEDRIDLEIFKLYQLNAVEVATIEMAERGFQSILNEDTRLNSSSDN